MKRLVIISFVASTIIFLLLPSSSLEVFIKCSTSEEAELDGVCPPLPTTAPGQEHFTGLTIYKIIVQDNIAVENTYPEIARNAVVFVPSFILLGVYLFKERSTNNIQ